MGWRKNEQGPGRHQCREPIHHGGEGIVSRPEQGNRRDARNREQKPSHTFGQSLTTKKLSF